MTETLTFTPRRTISSAMILVAVALIAVSMALGFGIRSWTETTNHRAPAAAVRIAPPTTPAPAGDSTPILRISGPR